MQAITDLLLDNQRTSNISRDSENTSTLDLRNNQIGDAGAARILTMQAITDLLLDNQRTSNISRDSENTSTSCQCKCTIL